MCITCFRARQNSSCKREQKRTSSEHSFSWPLSSVHSHTSTIGYYLSGMPHIARAMSWNPVLWLPPNDMLLQPLTISPSQNQQYSCSLVCSLPHSIFTRSSTSMYCYHESLRRVAYLLYVAYPTLLQTVITNLVFNRFLKLPLYAHL